MVELIKRNIEISIYFLDFFSTLQVEKLAHKERFLFRIKWRNSH